MLVHALATKADAPEAMIAREVGFDRTPDDETLHDTWRQFTGRSTRSADSLTPPRHRLHACAARRYDYAMGAPRTRRIWHFEAEPLCHALNEAGAWQTAVRIRVAHDEALRRRPVGTAFDVRPTPEDVAPLNLALDTLRAERARESRLS